MFGRRRDVYGGSNHRETTMSMKILLASLVLTGCAAEGADDAIDADAGPTTTTTTPTFTRAQARLLGEALAAAIEDTAERFGPVTSNAKVAPACATPSGDTSDVDNDSIPADATLTFDCFKRRLGFTGTVTGEEMVSDLQPEALAWAFSASTNLHASLEGPFGGTVVADTTGELLATQQSIAGPFRLTTMLDVQTLVTNVSGNQTALSEEQAFTIAFQPQFSWNSGDPIV